MSDQQGLEDRRLSSQHMHSASEVGVISQTSIWLASSLSAVRAGLNSGQSSEPGIKLRIKTDGGRERRPEVVSGNSTAVAAP